MSTKNMETKSLDLVFSEVKERLVIQFEAIDSLDSKVGTVLSTASVVMSIGAGLQLSFPNAIEVGPLIVLIAGAIAYCACMAYSVQAFQVRDYRRDPEPRPLMDNYLDEDEALTKRQLIANLVESFESNVAAIDRKASCVDAAIKLLAVQTSALTIVVIWRALLGE